MCKTEQDGRLININGKIWKEYLYDGTATVEVFQAIDVILSNGNRPYINTCISQGEDNE